MQRETLSQPGEFCEWEALKFFYFLKCLYTHTYFWSGKGEGDFYQILKRFNIRKSLRPKWVGVGFPEVGQGRGHWVGPGIRPRPALGGGDFHAVCPGRSSQRSLGCRSPLSLKVADLQASHSLQRAVQGTGR